MVRDRDRAGSRSTAVTSRVPEAYKATLLAVYSFYLVLGNLARPAVYLVGGGGLPVTEVVLALIAGLGLLYLRPRAAAVFVVIAGAVLVSCVIGYFTNGGISVLPALYAMRVIAIMVGSVVIAHIMHERWGKNPESAFRFFLLIFVVQAAIGWALLAVFPDTGDLLQAIRAAGLHFYGEPHQNRMLGPVLDPNYFGNLLVLAVGITVGLTVASGISWVVAAYALFIATLLYTVSRSSVIGLLGWSAMYAVLRRRHTRGGPEPLRVYGILLGIAVLTAGLLHEQVYTIIQRTVAIPSVASDVHRFASILDAVRLFLQPRILFLGLGYNFLPVVLKSRYGLTDFTASIGHIFLALGLPLGTLVAAALVRWVRGVVTDASRAHPLFGDVMLAYLVASVAMSTFTNLLLFAPFLWTVLPILCFLHTASQQRSPST